jgi:hypothetical protein
MEYGSILLREDTGKDNLEELRQLKRRIRPR